MGRDLAVLLESTIFNQNLVGKIFQVLFSTVRTLRGRALEARPAKKAYTIVSDAPVELTKNMRKC